MSEKEILNFEAETKQILNLMVHSIYTHKEIFLRELISNGSDALDKARFESITKSDKYKNIDDLKILIEVDAEARTIKITDNGIGMTREEVVQNIGSIARSGTKLFLENLEKNKDKKEGGIDLIGQFGVGFYSAFMVSDKITIETRSVESEIGIKWESIGDGTYSIEDTERSIEKRGTEITLQIKKMDSEDSESDYVDIYALQRLIKKYSDYVNYPIMMNMPKMKEKDEDKEEFELKTVNSMVSIWQKNKSNITKEEYNEFYKAHFHDYQEPFEVIHSKVEGVLEYTALLFLPRKSQFNFLSPDNERGLELYSKNVFIMDKCKDLIPEYLRFVKGLIDSPDFSLNISREILQHTNQLKKIASNIEKKILDLLQNTLKKDREKYEEFYGEFGESIKVGIYSDFTQKEKLQNLLLFKTSNDKDKYSTLAEYKDRMKEGQDFIYYSGGASIESIERLPHMEGIRAKGYEVLYFTDRVDEFMVSVMRDFEGTSLRSISHGKIEETKEGEEKVIDAKTTDVLTAMKEALGDDKIFDVVESDRLESSAVCLVSKDDGLTFNMAKVLAESGNNTLGMKAERILEVNTKHGLFDKIRSEYEENKASALFKEYSELFYDQACILEGLPLDDPTLFAKRMSDLMIK